LDGELESFIESHINTFIKWDLTVFFHNNPGVKETAAGVSLLLGRNESDIGTALDELAQSKLLVKKVIEGKKFFYYDPDPEIKEMVERFVSCLDAREKRLLVLTKFLRMEANR
jgi:hypothetical protein